MTNPVTEESLTEVLTNDDRDAAAWQQLALTLEKKDLGAAILAATRAVGRGEPPDHLRDLLSRPEQLSEDDQKEKSQATGAVIDGIKRLGGEPAKVVKVALEALVEGGDPTYLLRSIAQTLDQVYSSIAALDVIRGAIAVAPSDRGWYEDTHALVLMSLARFDEASSAIERLAALDPEQASWLKTYLTALSRPYDHWLKLMFNDPGEDLALTTRSLNDCHQALQQTAARIAQLRTSLQALVGEQPWLPDVSTLLGDAPSDRDYEDEQGSVPNLLLETRVEWTRLCYLLTCMGATELALPSALKLPPQPFELLDTLLAVRFNLLCDQGSGAELEVQDELDEMMMQTKWGGTPLPELKPHLAELWLSEHRAALAAVRWADGKIDSALENQ